MNMLIRTGLSAALFCVAVGGLAGTPTDGTWRQTLQPRDLDGDNSTAEAYYDTDLDITWLRDANFARTGGYDSDGLMFWDQAMSWAASVSPYGISGWRLPTMTDLNNDGGTFDEKNPDFYNGIDEGFWADPSLSEMVHLHYVTLGNTAWFNPDRSQNTCSYEPPNFCLTNTGPFLNMLPKNYWTNVEYAPVTAHAWHFTFSGGLQRWNGKTDPIGRASWLVHDGDIGSPLISVLFADLLADTTNVGPGKSLADKVRLAQTYYTAGDIPATCAVLSDFVSTVQGFATGKNPKLSDKVAAHLIAEAEAIMAAIGCD